MACARIKLFGAWALDEAAASSALDFVLELANKSFEAYIDLKPFLEDLFSCPVGVVLAD